MWVRGLKLLTLKSLLYVLVAPHVGAWIETLKSLRDFKKLYMSHPMWVRGLKHRVDNY